MLLINNAGEVTCFPLNYLLLLQTLAVTRVLRFVHSIDHHLPRPPPPPPPQPNPTPYLPPPCRLSWQRCFASCSQSVSPGAEFLTLWNSCGVGGGGVRGGKRGEEGGRIRSRNRRPAVVRDVLRKQQMLSGSHLGGSATIPTS